MSPARTRGPSRQPPLVGRERELAWLLERLDAAGRGESTVVLLSGEPGVGKTRLLSEVSERAAAQGWRVLVGQALDSEGMPPYLPFIEALREHVRTCPLDELRAQLGDGAADVALVLPDVGRRLPGASAHQPVDRSQLFDSLSGFIDAIARASASGLVLCFDDVHWADDSTLLLLEHVCRRLHETPVLVIAAYRDTELDAGRPLARTLELLTRQRMSQRLDVKRLDVDGVRSLLAALGRPEPSPPLVEAVYQETEGNPFFTLELFEYLSGEGRLFDASGAWRGDLRVGATEVPQSVRLVIGRRLERLSAQCRTALTLAAVLGRTLEFDALRGMSELDEAGLLEVLDEAEAAQILVSDDLSRLTFNHELVRQTLLASLTALRRQRLHLRAADVLERLGDADSDASLAEIAGHFRMAGGAADPSSVVDYCARAGERALHVQAYQESVKLFEDAIAAGQGRQVDLAILHRKCGQANASLAQWPEARRHREAALAMLAEGEVEARCELLLDLAVACRWDGDLNRSRRYAEEAHALADRLARPDLQAGAVATMALVDFSEGNIAHSAAQYAQAIERSRSEDRSVSKTAEAGYAHLLYLSGRHRDAIEHGRRGVELARELGDMATLTFALGPLGLSLAASGRYTEAQEAFAQARHVGSQYGIGGYLARAVSMSATPHMDLFDLDGALQLAQEAGELGARFDFVPARVSTAIDCVSIYFRSGDTARAIDAWPSVRASVMDVVSAPGTWLHGWLWSLRLAHIDAEVALARGEFEEAARLASVAVEASRARLRPKYEAASLATRAGALMALGRKRDAIADVGAAIQAARATGDPALFVRIAATGLRVEAEEGLAKEAQAAVGLVLDGVSEPRLRRSFEDSATVQFIAGLSNVRRQSHPDGLSQREVEVLRLVAAGKSNAQIADELVISINTVQRHVVSILTKTQAANRTQAASYAHRMGLVAD